jgi:ankyrin repeat protein
VNLRAKRSELSKSKKKHITLPKDFSDILNRGKRDEILAVFELCDINATGGYGKQTAPAFDQLSDEILRWMADQGADLTLTDTWKNTPLHCAADSFNPDNAQLLLSAGARVNKTDDEGFILLELALRGFNNMDYELKSAKKSIGSCRIIFRIRRMYNRGTPGVLNGFFTRYRQSFRPLPASSFFRLRPAEPSDFRLRG